MSNLGEADSSIGGRLSNWLELQIHVSLLNMFQAPFWVYTYIYIYKYVCMYVTNNSYLLGFILWISEWCSVFCCLCPLIQGKASLVARRALNSQPFCRYWRSFVFGMPSLLWIPNLIAVPNEAPNHPGCRSWSPSHFNIYIYIIFQCHWVSFIWMIEGNIEIGKDGVSMGFPIQNTIW